MLSECKDSANEEQIKKLKMKNASSFTILFKCKFGLIIFFALACIIHWRIPPGILL